MPTWAELFAAGAISEYEVEKIVSSAAHLLGQALAGELPAGPLLKGLMVYNSNPVATCPDQDKLVEGLKQEDLFTVVSEQGAPRCRRCCRRWTGFWARFGCSPREHRLG